MPSESFCRVVEDAKYKTREKRERNDKPQPWILVKLMVPITFGIMVYAAYVYIGRTCVPAIRRQSSILSKGGGIALLAVFCPLFIWMVWAYAVVVLTPPGFARDHVPKSPQPPPSAPGPSQSFVPANGDIESGTLQNPARSSTLVRDRDSIGGPSYEDLELRAALESNERHDNALSPRSMPPIRVIDHDDKAPPQKDHDLRIKMAMMNVERRPPITPILLPEYRYCVRDELVKPYRAHHCRVCGTCILKYDHHCPWIGQCVGARNHKFFINFNQAAAVFTAYTFATLLPYTIRAQDDLDVQHVVILALSALFCVFTISLFLSHMRLLYLSETTVESMRDRSILDREEHVMSGALGLCDLSTKKRLRATWDQEWGRIGKEGNIWWLESGRKGWEETMGSWWVGWILPVGRGLSNGLDYTPNPRFDKEGRWRRRSEWPIELR